MNLVGGHAVSGALLAAAGATTAAATPRLDSYRSSPAYRRVLIVAPQPFYQDRGTPIAVRQVLEGLSQLGYSVDLLTYPVGSDIQVPGVRLFRTPNPMRFRNVPVGLSLKKILLDIPLTLQLAARLRNNAYTCIHAVEEAAFPAVLLGHHHKLPVIYDMQSSLSEQLATYPGLRATPLRRVLESLEGWLLSRADMVVSSAGLASRVREIAPQVTLREWHYPSVMVPAAKGDTDRLRRGLAIPPGAPIVLYGGTFESYQGLKQLIQAIPLVRAQVPDAMFVLVGAENGSGTAVRAQGAALLEAGALRIIDRQPRHQIPGYLGLADILVSPRSYGGNLPLKVFDYLAAGRPIVATDIPTHRTVLTEDRAVLVAPQTEDIARGIVSLLRNPERAERLARAAR
ncbi:MAG TPA: glycosyltransferase, partial [Gemmatimonadales bacterium]|nr:glycosyltransferase [Gemmatimonadales bacterium]